ncbi:MAG: hypothetical protein HRF42_12445 [Candidatus Brocadia sp.]
MMKENRDLTGVISQTSSPNILFVDADMSFPWKRKSRKTLSLNVLIRELDSRSSLE